MLKSDLPKYLPVPTKTTLLPLISPNSGFTEIGCNLLPGGYGWLNFLDYKTGATISGSIVAVRTNAPIVGLNVLYVNGKPVTNIVTADNPTPTSIKETPYGGAAYGGFTNHRVIWRELIDEE